MHPSCVRAEKHCQTHDWWPEKSLIVHQHLRTVCIYFKSPLHVLRIRDVLSQCSHWPWMLASVFITRLNSSQVQSIFGKRPWTFSHEGRLETLWTTYEQGDDSVPKQGDDSKYHLTNIGSLIILRQCLYIESTRGGWFNIKMPSYQYRNSHCGDKTILRPSYLHKGMSYTGKMTSLYWIWALCACVCRLHLPTISISRAPFTNMD